MFKSLERYIQHIYTLDILNILKKISSKILHSFEITCVGILFKTTSIPQFKTLLILFLEKDSSTNSIIILTSFKVQFRNIHLHYLQHIVEVDIECQVLERKSSSKVVNFEELIVTKPKLYIQVENYEIQQTCTSYTSVIEFSKCS